MAPITNNGPAPSTETLTYDYRNSMRGWDIVTQVVCLVISTICVALRMFSKVFIVRETIAEDWTCLLAWVCFHHVVQDLQKLTETSSASLAMESYASRPTSMVVVSINGW